MATTTTYQLADKQTNKQSNKQNKQINEQTNKNEQTDRQTNKYPDRVKTMHLPLEEGAVSTDALVSSLYLQQVLQAKHWTS